MKRLAVVFVLGALALATYGASAESHYHAHPSANTYGHGQNRFQNVFESNAQGRQSYPNPDRDLPQSCGC